MLFALASTNTFFSLTTKISSLNHQSTSETSATTIKAWQAYLISLRYADPAASKARRLNWLNTFDKVPAPDGFREVVEKQLKETKAPSYDLLVVGAYLLDNDPKRAISLQLQAKPLLPLLPNGQPDEAEAKDYYRHLAHYYLADQPEENIKATP